MPITNDAWVREITNMPEWLRVGAEVAITGSSVFATGTVAGYDVSHVYVKTGNDVKPWNMGRFMQFWGPYVPTRFERVR